MEANDGVVHSKHTTVKTVKQTATTNGMWLLVVGVDEKTFHPSEGHMRDNRPGVVSWMTPFV